MVHGGREAVGQQQHRTGGLRARAHQVALAQRAALVQRQPPVVQLLRRTPPSSMAFSRWHRAHTESKLPLASSSSSSTLAGSCACAPGHARACAAGCKGERVLRGLQPCTALVHLEGAQLVVGPAAEHHHAHAPRHARLQQRRLELCAAPGSLKTRPGKRARCKKHDVMAHALGACDTSA